MCAAVAPINSTVAEYLIEELKSVKNENAQLRASVEQWRQKFEHEHEKVVALSSRLQCLFTLLAYFIFN
jgi:hypothetical protein